MAITKVLIVDDAATDRSNLQSIVTSAGYVASTASSGREALERIARDKPDVIFLDILMPDMDGFELCRGLRANDTTKSTPIVVVSSKNQKADRVWALEQGANAYVAKPYKPEDIIDSIRRL
ncbi:MAG TPA: response regulator [Steroidobacteraceae bacterium]|nr:response regulator [Steroidobacteraceae bacterium]